MTKPRTHQLAPALNDLNIAITLTNNLIAHAEDWQPGYGNGQGTGRAPKGTHSDPTARAATNPPRHEDHLTEQVLALNTELAHIINRIRWAATEARHLAPIDPKTAFLKEEAQRIPGRGACQVNDCDTHCAGGPDRLMAGYCGRHYQQWVRLGRPDRGLFERGHAA